MGKEYYLMHKNVRVCLMEIDEGGRLSRIRINQAEKEHVPLGGQMNSTKFHEWWRDRAIPKTRHGAQTALQRLGYPSTGSALVNNLALSLSDCYWIMPRGADLSWEDINLFANDFVDSFGEITINRDFRIDLRKATRFDCAASQGELQKKWCIDADGRRYMIKGNYGQSYQQSLNEVFASSLHRQQGFLNHAEYTLADVRIDGDQEGLGCLCYDFCSEGAECISAWELLQTVKLRSNESYYYPLKEVCLSLGMKEADFTAFMDYQIMTDFLISNTDRHMNNIAVMRDPDTLEIRGFAPIYDSGNSMFYNVSYEGLKHVNVQEIKTHSFIEREIRLLQYVQDRAVVDLDQAAMDFSVYRQDVYERRIRVPELQRLYEKKLDLLQTFQSGKDIWKTDYLRRHP